VSLLPARRLPTTTTLSRSVAVGVAVAWSTSVDCTAPAGADCSAVDCSVAVATSLSCANAVACRLPRTAQNRTVLLKLRAMRDFPRMSEAPMVGCTACHGGVRRDTPRVAVALQLVAQLFRPAV